MSFTPLTEEQYNKAIDSGFKPEEIINFEKQRKSNEDNIDIKSNDSMATQGIGYLKEHPIKALLQGLVETATGKTAEQMAVDSVNSPEFGQSKEAPFDKNIPNAKPTVDFKIVGGQIIDQATAPINYIGGAAIKAGAKILPKLLKYDTALVQATKAKTSLDTIRTNLGKAKEIALSNTGDIPVDVNFSGNVSKKVVEAIKNPIYGVEFSPEGGVIGNIRNLDKVKTALNDLVTTKDFVEAGNMEKRQIMQFAGRVRNDMVKAANDAGKPELGQSLADYHDFMGNYNKINDHLVDKYGDAMANKLKTMFKPEAEQAVRESWKELSKTSPEIKSIMDSMNKRSLISGLLKKAGYAGAAATAIEAGKKVITGKF